jgi:hypothetical protein
MSADALKAARAASFLVCWLRLENVGVVDLGGGGPSLRLWREPTPALRYALDKGLPSIVAAIGVGVPLQFHHGAPEAVGWAKCQSVFDLD